MSPSDCGPGEDSISGIYVDTGLPHCFRAKGHCYLRQICTQHTVSACSVLRRMSARACPQVELVLCHVDLQEMRRLLAAHRVMTQRPGDSCAREFATFEAGMHYVEETYLKACMSQDCSMMRALSGRPGEHKQHIECVCIGTSHICRGPPVRCGGLSPRRQQQSTWTRTRPRSNNRRLKDRSRLRLPTCPANPF